MKLSERVRKAEILSAIGLWTGTYEITEEELDEVAKLEAENEALRDAMRNAIYVDKTGGNGMNYLHRALLTGESDENVVD